MTNAWTRCPECGHGFGHHPTPTDGGGVHARGCSRLKPPVRRVYTDPRFLPGAPDPGVDPIVLAIRAGIHRGLAILPLED